MCRRTSSEWTVVLPKSRVGSTSTRVAGTPAPDAASAPSPQGAQDVAHDVEVVGTVGDVDRIGARREAAGVGDDVTRADPGRHVHEVVVVPGPRVVDEVEADVAGGLRDLGPPGVEAEGELGVRGAGVLEERQDPVDLLLRRDDLALLAGAHPADVDDVGALLDRALEGGLRRVEVGVPVAGEEGVGACG